MRYFFILGRNPELSLAELNAVLPQPRSFIAHGGDVVIVEYPKLNHEEIIKRLGGTIKMGVIQGTINREQLTSSCLLRYFYDLFNEKKIFIGLSAYAFDEKARLVDSRQLRQLGIGVKRALQERGHKVRLVTSKQPTLSSVTVEKEKLLSQGAEIVLLFTRGDIFIGKTLAVQEFEQASQRDYGRPARSMGVGMIPIQLAKIMINLARAPKSATLLDPFCGLGTILSEASMMGYKNLIGSDIEQKMIEATRENLSWLKAHQKELSCDSAPARPCPQAGKFGGESQDSQLLVSPVEELSKHLAPNSIDAIVTEPYLGPVRGMQNAECRMQNELVKLYLRAFEQFVKILKPNGRVVFVFPAFKQNNQLIKTSEKVLPQIKKLGFMPTITPITYLRSDQKVLREIFVFGFKPRP